ncbi:hypothetical protein D6C76_05474 [Aureobasidium pullulans]|uniref:Uncharacterized protein n=1 Tax=Aureobasidium pullulans TaxID=5580 RepID=A0AB74JMN0_AURPU|nr:hypothetical protein D6D12_07485 [Aureobasidium pullulans]THX61187.1 hypothetical protein D6D11_02859 [Aureobasidium pullulans]TIA76699.1 hypothetical protein D6C76_05474 [Aureobasidium pullulans]
MGRISEESASTRSSFDAEGGEGLPLYSDISVAQTGELVAPDPKATPDEVRDFLVRLLIKNRGLHEDHARRVASKWTLGTGRELSSYPPLLYAEIFGMEDAWMVYKEAKLFIEQEKAEKAPKGGKYIALFIMSAVESSLITMAVIADSEPFQPLAITGSIMFGFAYLIFLLCAFVAHTVLEDSIEAELRKGLVERNKD